MDKPVIFMQFLLMLVVAVNALPNCKCGKHSTMKHAVCLQHTLIMASPKSVKYLALNRQPVNNPEDSYFSIYTMNLNTKYRDGYSQLGDEPIFELVGTTRKDGCGVEMELETDYFISGTAINETLLLVHDCDYLERVPWSEKTVEEMEEMNDFLTRQTEVDCSNFCVMVTYFNTLMPC